MSKHKCIVYGCSNHKGEGGFTGDICDPCYRMITKGDAAQPSTNFIHGLHLYNKAVWSNEMKGVWIQHLEQQVRELNELAKKPAEVTEQQIEELVGDNTRLTHQNALLSDTIKALEHQNRRLIKHAKDAWEDDAKQQSIKIVEKPERKIVQISAIAESSTIMVFALCNDGALFTSDKSGDWKELKDIPQE